MTKCVEPRQPILVSGIAQTIAETFRWYTDHGKLQVAAFVVMPDHWHLMFHSGESDDVGLFMRKACHWISRKTGDGLRAGGVEWQDGFHETRIRTLRQFQYVRHYIEENPVRKEWVSAAIEWPWSSAHPEYRGIVPPTWPFQFEEEK